MNNDAAFYKAEIYPTVNRSFTRANTFLDLCLIDNRLQIIDSINNKIKTCEYNSDHNGTTFSIKLNPDSNIERSARTTPIKLYKNTNWKLFGKCIRDSLTFKIPAKKNLINDEIDDHLNK